MFLFSSLRFQQKIITSRDRVLLNAAEIFRVVPSIRYTLDTGTVSWPYSSRVSSTSYFFLIWMALSKIPGTFLGVYRAQKAIRFSLKNYFDDCHAVPGTVLSNRTQKRNSRDNRLVFSSIRSFDPNPVSTDWPD